MNRRSRHAALSMLIAALCLLATAHPISAGAVAELFVDDDAVYGATGCDDTGSVAFSTIQDAVDAAVVADTKIRVCPGTYVGQVEIDAEDPDGLVIRATIPWAATLMPDPAADPESLIRIADVDNTKIVWLNIELPTAEPCGHVDMAINVAGAENTMIRANHIRAIGTDTAGSCGFERGIRATNAPNTRIAFNRVIDFQVVGIGLSQTSGTVIRGNTVRFNHAAEDVLDDARGIELSESPQAKIVDNVVGSLASAGDTTPMLNSGIVVTAESDGTQIKGNRVFRSGRGIDLEGTTGLTVSNNRVRFAESFGIGLLFSADNNTVNNNSVHRGAERGITIQGPTGNQVHDNDFRDNGEEDCQDSSFPLANTWTNNLGDDSDPPGLCSPT